MSRIRFGSLLSGAVALAFVTPLQGAIAIAAPAKASHAQPVSPRDWTGVVSMTPAGGFVMGNPKASVKLVEFGSMTCPHCKVFDDVGVPNIINGYVRTGKVSYEFRNYVRDASDVAASQIARCGGASRFFPLTRALYKDQSSWQSKVENTPQDELSKIQDLPPNKEFLEIAKAGGLLQWASARGLPVGRSTQCLSDENSIKRLIQITQDTRTQFPDFRGTPTFLINGSMVELGAVTEGGVWPAVESKIKAALRSRG